MTYNFVNISSTDSTWMILDIVMDVASPN